MNKRYTKLLALGLGTLLCLGFFGGKNKNPEIAYLEETLAEAYKTLEVEKIYVHADKYFVFPGEDMWMSVYLRDAKDLSPAGSHIAYLELLDPKGSELLSQKLIARNGQAAAQWTIPKDAQGGIYKLRAYSKVSKAQDIIFERDIQVQKAVLPRLNMRLDFDRKAYGAGASVRAWFHAQSLENSPLAQKSFEAQLLLDGQEYKTEMGRTNALGQASIEMQLPDSLKSNDALLLVRILHKESYEAISRSVPLNLGDIDLQFFAEGGSFLAGTPTKLGFKALNEFGKAADVEGYIRNAAGKTVAQFSSYHQGMGSVELQAKAGERYTAHITAPSKLQKTYELPAVQEQGLALRIDSESKDWKISINNTMDFEEEDDELFLLIRKEDKLLYSKELSLAKGKSELLVDSREFPMGIVQVSIISNDIIGEQIWAERLVFANRDKQMQIQITSNKDKYLPREEVELLIEAKDHKGKPISGFFSLAVSDESLLSFADDRQGHILSALLLESDLQGEIEEPNFYFDNEQDPSRLKAHISRQKALDNLLLTQGWRGITWKEVLELNFEKPAKKEQACFTGSIVNVLSQKPIAGAEVQVLGTDYKTTSDSFGNFSLYYPELYEKVELRAWKEGYFMKTLTVSTYQYVSHISLISSSYFQMEEGSGFIYGKVITLDDEKPVVFARVQFKKDGKVIREVDTDFDGEYRVANMPPGVFECVVEDLGLPKLRISQVEIKEGNIHKADILFPSNLEGEGASLDFLSPRPPSAMTLTHEQMERMATRDISSVVSRARGVSSPNDSYVDGVRVFGSASAESALPSNIQSADSRSVELPKIQESQASWGENERKSTTAYTRTKQFYVPAYRAEKSASPRQDFRHTIYWNPSLELKEGKAKLRFPTSDALTQFRITIEGLSDAGQIGRAEQNIYSQKPLQLALKVPQQALGGDSLRLALSISNNSKQALDALLNIELPSNLSYLQEPPSKLSLAAKSTQIVTLNCLVMQIDAEEDIKLHIGAGDIEDAMQLAIKSKAAGFAVQELYRGGASKQHFALDLSGALPGTVQASIELFSSPVRELLKDMKALLRMPSGCFEQVSSNNYPNLLVLDYLRKTGQAEPQIEQQALQMLQVGYEKLTGYESQGGGFDWYGRSPAHEALTAYGILQFSDMQEVMEVDTRYIDRAVQWLLSRRDGQGGWLQNPKGYHSWAKSEISNTYIVWALCEAGYAKDIEKELDAAYTYAQKSQDPYCMALLANALLACKDTRSQKLITILLDKQEKDGSFHGLEHSVVLARGNNLHIETTALAALALMRSGKGQRQVIKAFGYLAEQKSYTGYGSTQGTVLTLKAFVYQAKSMSKTASDGELILFVDGKKQASFSYKAGQKELLFDGLEQYLKEGKQVLTLQYKKSKQCLPFNLEVSHKKKELASSEELPLHIENKLLAERVELGNSLRMNISLQNKSQESLASSMAMIGIPAGLSLQPWQLKELQERKVFDYYELFDGYLVLHYERLDAGEEKQIRLDLKADIAGSYQAPPSSLFLYYENQKRAWARPVEVRIE